VVILLRDDFMHDSPKNRCSPHGKSILVEKSVLLLMEKTQRSGYSHNIEKNSMVQGIYGGGIMHKGTKKSATAEWRPH